MGGGFMFSGKSTSFTAVNPPPFPAAATVTKDFNTYRHPCATISSDATVSESKGGYSFGPVPSRIEVERAISDLERFMHDLSNSQDELDAIRSLLYHDHDGKMMEAAGFARFSDAFSMMQKEQAIRSMVISISCDKSVWDAIHSNKEVQDIQASIPLVREQKQLNSNTEEPDVSTLIMKWIMGFTKSKIMELLAKFGLLVKDTLQPGPKDKPTSELTDLLEEKIRSSLLLSVVILVIVVVTRSQG